MDRRELQYFAKLYEMRNVTKASDELHLARQSLSGAIAKLERDVGAPLFVRSRSGMEPTEVADLLYQFARREAAEYRKIAREYEAVLAKARQTRELHSVSFGATWELMPSEAIEKIASLQYREGSCIEVEFLNTTACAGWKDVCDNVIDVVFTRKLPPAKREGIEWELVLPNRAFALVSSDDPLSGKESCDFFHDLLGYKYLCPYEEALSEIGIYLRKSSIQVKALPANFTIIGSVLVGEKSVCVLPEKVAHRVVEHFDGRITAIPCPDYPLSTDGYLIYRSNPPEYLRTFVSDVGKVIAKVLGGAAASLA